MTEDGAIPLPHVSGPANAALAASGIPSLNVLALQTEEDIAALHGMGPKGIRILKAALADAGLTFAPSVVGRRANRS